MKKQRIAQFLVPGVDNAIVEQIKDLCAARQIVPEITYHGSVSFRGKNNFTLFSTASHIYQAPIGRYEVMRYFHGVSDELQRHLITSSHPLVSCIGKECSSILTPAALKNAAYVSRALILYQQCPTFQPWIEAFMRFLPPNHGIKVSPCVTQIINEL